MGFLDYLFVKKEGGDQRHFPCHEEVLRFLEDFARDFGLMGLIRFQHEVVRVERVDDASHDWVVESRTREIEPKWKSKEEVFEAVVICNGNHTEPKIAEFPEILGQDCKCIAITTELLNSLKNKIVLLIGNGPSAIDVLREIGPLAKQVHQAIRGPNFQLKRLEKYDNAWQHII
ncbi:hypothetical protein V6N13_146473 [Hibiscus sabdariffa]